MDQTNPTVTLELLKFLESLIPPTEELLDSRRLQRLGEAAFLADLWGNQGAQTVLTTLAGIYQQQTGHPYVYAAGTARRDSPGSGGTEGGGGCADS